MTRGNFRGSNHRGRGNGGRPGSRGGNRGRGRGFGRGRGRGDAPPVDYDVLDFPVQMWPENDGYGNGPGHGSMALRSRANGFRGQRGTASTSGRNTPRGNFAFQPRGRGHAGIGSPTRAKQQTKPKSLGSDLSLSSLLYESRPLLRPIVFVKSSLTPCLFQEEEELMEPALEEVEDAKDNDMPTANRVAQVFDGSITVESDLAENDDEEELEEIDFNDTERLLEVRAKPVKKFKVTAVEEEQFSGYRKQTTSPFAPPSASHVESDRHEDQTVASPGIDVVNEGIAEISITSEPRQGIVDVGVTAQETTITTKDGEVWEQSLFAPVLDAQMSGNIILQRKSINDEVGSEVNAVVARNETAQETTAIPMALPLSTEAQKVDINEELTVERELMETVPEPEPEPEPEPPEAVEAAGFFIDTIPSRISFAERCQAERLAVQILGVPEALEDDEEVIVYVAPHPRSGRTTPAIGSSSSAPPALPTTSVLTGLPTIDESTIATTSTFRNVKEKANRTPAPPSTVASTSRTAEARYPRQFVSPVLPTTPKKQRKGRMYEAQLAKRRKGKRSMFLLGAARQEMEWQELEGRDPKWEERRRGDSDIDWGDGDDGGLGEGKMVADGMDIDPELRDEKSMAALGSFADGMLSQGGTRFVTMDDIADIEKLRMEDEGSDGGAKGNSEDDASDDEDEEESDDDVDIDAVLEKEEEMMIAEGDEIELSEDDDEEDEEQSDDELSPRSSFQARLERIRNRAKKRADTSYEVDISQYTMKGEEDDEDEFDKNYIWEDYFFDPIDGIENQGILTGRDRKEKKRLFKAISNGNFDDFSTFTVAKRKKDKHKDIPLSLQKQWEKDRARKAERKAARELAKLEAAADSLVKKKSGKKVRKAMLAAARLDPKITTIAPNRVIDMTMLVQQIRRFLADPNGPRTMSLPPTNKYCRKLIHEMAIAFDLKSKSNGHEGARYTTLIRKSRSGLSVDEKKVTQIVKRSRGGEFYRGKGDGEQNGNGKGKQYGSLRQKEGEEVGKAAPKIDSSNLGFKMLEAMGWSEGKQIGVTGGLDKPLTAIIKHSKLGLGATKQ